MSAGELQTNQAQAAVTDLIERSRKNTERLLEQVRKDIRDQVGNLGLATKADIARLERQIAAAEVDRRKAAAKKATKAAKAPGQEGGEASPAKKAARPQQDRGVGPVRRPRPDGGSTPSSSAGAWSPSREQAREAIEAGRVIVGGAPAAKAARLVGPGEPIRLSGPRPRFVEPRRREARRRARSLRGRRRRRSGSSTPAPRPAASPTACCSVARPRSSPSTSATASCTSGCATIRGSRSIERTNIRDRRPAVDRGSRRPGGGRPVVHLAAHGGRDLLGAGRAGGDLVAAGQAAVRGGARRSVHGDGA